MIIDRLTFAELRGSSWAREAFNLRRMSGVLMDPRGKKIGVQGPAEGALPLGSG